MSTPTRRIRSPCCAPAVSGHAAAPPSRVMNSRRLMRLPRTKDHVDKTEHSTNGTCGAVARGKRPG
jgi:hypothetical protein